MEGRIKMKKEEKIIEEGQNEGKKKGKGERRKQARKKKDGDKFHS